MTRGRRWTLSCEQECIRGPSTGQRRPRDWNISEAWGLLQGANESSPLHEALALLDEIDQPLKDSDSTNLSCIIIRPPFAKRLLEFLPEDSGTGRQKLQQRLSDESQPENKDTYKSHRLMYRPMER